MNQTQLKYARNRAEDIFITKRKEIEKRNTTDAVNLTDAEKLQAIRDGEFKVDSSYKKGHYLSWHNGIIFTQEKRKIRNQEKINKETEILEQKYRNLTDELVLGDNEAALELLKAFENA